MLPSILAGLIWTGTSQLILLATVLTRAWSANFSKFCCLPRKLPMGHAKMWRGMRYLRTASSLAIIVRRYPRDPMLRTSYQGSTRCSSPFMECDSTANCGGSVTQSLSSAHGTCSRSHIGPTAVSRHPGKCEIFWFFDFCGGTIVQVFPARVCN